MIRSLQACRCLAGLLIVLHHTSNGIFALPKYFDGKPFGNVFDIGEAGLDYFLVLSGFVIAYVHGKEIGRLDRVWSYVRKRVTRVYPTYWVVMLLLVPVFFIAPQLGMGYERDPSTIVCSFLLLPHPNHGPILGVAWTILYELFFYAVFAVLIANRRWGVAVVAVWFAAIVAARFYAPLATFPYLYATSVYHLRFLAGMLLALAVRRGLSLPVPRLLACAGAVWLLASALVNAYGGGWNLFEPILGYTPSCVLLMIGLIDAERAGMVRMPALLVHLGDASYSIYLVHFPALSVLAKVAKLVYADAWLPLPLLFGLIAVGAVAVSYVFYRAVECPLRRYFQERRGVPDAPLEVTKRHAA